MIRAWKRRLGYAWHQFKMRHTYWVVTCPDGSAGFVSLGCPRAVTHFARHYLNANGSEVVQRKWYTRMSKGDLEYLTRRYGLVVASYPELLGSLDARAVQWPWLVEMVITVPATVEALRNSLPTSALSDLRRMRSNGLTVGYSKGRERGEVFYRDFYVPSMDAKHGRDAYLFDLANIYELLDNGGLFIEVWMEGRCVAMALREVDGDGLHLRRIGWLNGDRDIYKKGVLGALYWFTLVWAVENRSRWITLGGVQPYLEEGLFHFKSKWGGRLDFKRSGFNAWRVLTESAQPDCQAFFERNSLLIKNEATGCFDVWSSRDRSDMPDVERHSDSIGKWLRPGG